MIEGLDYKATRAEFKLSDSSPNGSVECYSAIFGNVDDYKDIILPGAFTKTITERVAAGRVLMLNSHDWTAGGVIGGMRSALEDNIGLLTNSDFSSVHDAQEVRTLIKEGFLDGVSVGIRVVQWEVQDQIRLIKECILWEHSIAPFPANDMARVIGIKSAPRPFLDLPLAASATKFAEADALDRVLKWAGCDGLNPNCKLDKAFIARDASKGWALDAYQGLIADVIGGKLVAVPEAVEKARECAASCSDEQAKIHAEKYYQKLHRASHDAGRTDPPKHKAGPGTPPTYNDRAQLKRRLIEIGGVN